MTQYMQATGTWQKQTEKRGKGGVLGDIAAYLAAAPPPPIRARFTATPAVVFCAERARSQWMRNPTASRPYMSCSSLIQWQHGQVYIRYTFPPARRYCSSGSTAVTPKERKHALLAAT
jgi:hypothetical protein